MLRVFVSGTTDSPCEVTSSPAPGERDVEFILKEVRNYLASDISGMFQFILIFSNVILKWFLHF